MPLDCMEPEGAWVTHGASPWGHSPGGASASLLGSCFLPQGVLHPEGALGPMQTHIPPVLTCSQPLAGQMYSAWP